MQIKEIILTKKSVVSDEMSYIRIEHLAGGAASFAALNNKTRI